MQKSRNNVWKRPSWMQLLEELQGIMSNDKRVDATEADYDMIFLIFLSVYSSTRRNLLHS